MLDLLFFTSSRIKMQNARHICRSLDINIKNFNEVTSFANYEEPRILNREEILETSFKNALNQLKRAGLQKRPFILEDTSVNINSLSRKEEREFPGVDVKYWMKEARFEDLDLELMMMGNDRSATVRSDLLLYLPEVSESPLHFVGKTDGKVVDSPSEFETNIVYPWLDNKTFNKWFQPQGEKSALGMLPIEKADVHDFRKKAFSEMFKVLEHYNLLKPKKYDFSAIKSSETWLDKINCHIVYGLSCAGKTTIATYLINEFDFVHVEASDFMHVIYREHHGIESQIPIGKFAKEILKSNPHMVAERVLKYIEKNGLENVVITGFRLLEEVEYIERSLPSVYEVKRVLLTANRTIRLDRKNLRKRSNESISDENLQDRDERELEMGISQLAQKQTTKLRLANEGTLYQFYDDYVNRLNLKNSPKQVRKKNSDFDVLTLKELIIMALYVARGDAEKSEFLSTTEITSLINSSKLKKPKFVANVGRFFKMHSNELFEIEFRKKTRRYRLSNTGVGFAKLILKKFEFIN
jgi:inosine/xanthosine triphosphate pyrophosphatase family protein/adenylate kinase family enzyme